MVLFHHCLYSFSLAHLCLPNCRCPTVALRLRKFHLFVVMCNSIEMREARAIVERHAGLFNHLFWMSLDIFLQGSTQECMQQWATLEALKAQAVRFPCRCMPLDILRFSWPPSLPIIACPSGRTRVYTSMQMHHVLSTSGSVHPSTRSTFSCELRCRPPEQG